MNDLDLQLYVNFAAHAILGWLGEADQIMRVYGDSVRHVADGLARECPVPSAPLYRGLMLDPAVPFAIEPKFTYLSWSEDRDVALWFACPRSAVSLDVARQKPALRGYIAELSSPRSRVLFHHSWAEALGGLGWFALLHPLMGEARKQQIDWSLRTQHEVITEPVADLVPECAPDLDGDALEMLERRLSPPWVVETEGLRR